MFHTWFVLIWHIISQQVNSEAIPEHEGFAQISDIHHEQGGHPDTHGLEEDYSLHNSGTPHSVHLEIPGFTGLP